ncbi:MAG: amidase [Defluviicoccus sp.]|nr:amidase [Defluviicoccus sp.]MDE0279230.1 amidase [Defluviicoccus sp.]
MSLDEELAFLSARELVARYRDGSLSPVEATRATLERIAALDTTINAYCLVDGDAAMAAARESEARWRRGAAAGPLDGVPTSIKDIVLTRGWPTLRGSKTIERDRDWADDAPPVARLREHGAVLLGKTTTPEFAMKGVTDSPLTGITRNPWNPDLTPGGSSGGAGAAVAAGMCTLALGTDAGGSIRIPASFCGVFGLKPSYGRVPVWPPTPFGTFASTGPMTRSVADAATMLNAIAEPDARDWNALPYDGTDYREGLDEGIDGVRIAYSQTLGYARVDGEVATIVDAAVEALAERGARVEREDPGFADPAPFWHVLFRGLTRFAFKDLTEDRLAVMDPLIAEKIRAAPGVDLETYLQAERRRAELGAHMKAFHRRYDLLVSPATAVAAFPAGRATPDRGPDADATEWPFSLPFNLTRQPAASVPCGFTADGRPVGLQIVGPQHGDALVLRAARAFETARPWSARRPDWP